MNLIWQDKIKHFLLEDIGRGDITTESIVEPGHMSQGRLIAKESGVLAGLKVAEATFHLLNKRIQFSVSEGLQDGCHVAAGDLIATVSGDTSAILMAERTALNLLQRLSGIATATATLTALIKDYPAKVTDTRKTMPGLGLLDKYAVRVGGGINHRMGLDDAVLIKDNHIAIAGGITEAVKRVKARTGHMIKTEVEVETLAQLKEALLTDVDVIMLDNMTLDNMRQAVQLVKGTASKGRFILEASGNVTDQTIRDVAATGVDVISVGWLTHSVRAMDISLKF